VCGQEHGRSTTARLPNDLTDPARGDGIEASCGFIQEQKFRSVE
jgi:hypothetical protein